MGLPTTLDIKRCRYGSAALRVLEGWEILWCEYDDDYQGECTIFATHFETGRYRILHWDWGSCKDCDLWESQGLTEEQIGRDMLSLCADFSSYESLIEWELMVKKTTSDRFASHYLYRALAYCRNTGTLKPSANPA